MPFLPFHDSYCDIRVMVRVFRLGTMVGCVFFFPYLSPKFLLSICSHSDSNISIPSSHLCFNSMEFYFFITVTDNETVEIMFSRQFLKFFPSDPILLVTKSVVWEHSHVSLSFTKPSLTTMSCIKVSPFRSKKINAKRTQDIFKI